MVEAAVRKLRHGVPRPAGRLSQPQSVEHACRLQIVGERRFPIGLLYCDAGLREVPRRFFHRGVRRKDSGGDADLSLNIA